MKLKKASDRIKSIMHVAGTAFIIYGLLLCIEAAGIPLHSGYVLAAVPFVLGLYLVILYFRKENRTRGALSMDFTVGLILMVTGGVILCYREAIYAGTPVVAGWLIAASTIVKLHKAIDLRRVDTNDYLLLLILTGISLLFAVFLIINPAFIAKYAIMISGILLFIDGLSLFFTWKVFWARYNRIVRKETDLPETPKVTWTWKFWERSKKKEPERLPQSERLTESLPEDEEPLTSTGYFADME